MGRFAGIALGLGALLWSGSAQAEDGVFLTINYEACTSIDCAAGVVTNSGRLALEGVCNPYDGICSGIVRGGAVYRSAWTLRSGVLDLSVTFDTGKTVDIDAAFSPDTRCLEGSFLILDADGSRLSEGLWTGCRG